MVRKKNLKFSLLQALIMSSCVIRELTENSLPTGLTLLTLADNTYISGTVAKDATTSGFTIQVTDENGTIDHWKTMIPVIDPLDLRIDSHDAVQHFPYQTIFTADHGTKPCDWIIDSLPQGLDYTISNSQAVVYGTPSICGQMQLNIFVEDSSYPPDKKVYPYDLFIKCQDDAQPDIQSGPYAPSKLSGKVTFNEMGVSNIHVSINPSLTGASSNDGSYELNGIHPGLYVVTFSHKDYCVQSHEIYIHPGENHILNTEMFKSNGTALKFEKTDLSPAYLEQWYTARVYAKGGCQPYIYSLCGNLLPHGLQLNPSTGEISGSSEEHGFYELCLQVSESSGLTATTYTSLTVLPEPMSVSHTQLNCAVQNMFYSNKIPIQHGFPPYVFDYTSSELPKGLRISSEGLITGICQTDLPRQIGIQITDDMNQTITETFYFDVKRPLTIDVPEKIKGIVGNVLDISLQSHGGCGNKKWHLFRSCDLGIDIHFETGQLYGIPQKEGFCTLVIAVDDAAGHRAYQDCLLQISNNLSVISDRLPAAYQGQYYSERVQTEGNHVELLFMAVDSLPQGLTINTQTGEISGIPEESGDYLFQIAIHDMAVSMPQSVTNVFKLRVQQSLTIMSPVMIPDADMNDNDWTYQLTAKGHTLPCTWTVLSGGLPSGVQLNSHTGQLSGKIMQSGNYSFDISLTDHSGKSTQKSFLWHIYAPLKLTTRYIPDAIQGHSYQKILEASGGKKPYQWELISGNNSWPKGLVFNRMTGSISGIPESGMDYRLFTVRVYDQRNNSDEHTFGLSVYAADTVRITEKIKNGMKGKIYVQKIETEITQGLQYPLIWSQDGYIPSGVKITCADTSCELSGKPKHAGNYPFVIQLRDSGMNPFQLTREYQLVIKDQLHITTEELQDAEPGIFYSEAITAQGGGAPYTFHLDGQLPEGLKLSDGAI